MLNLNADEFVASFGNAGLPSVPSKDQWQRVLGRPDDQPITLINFFKLNEMANYPEGSAETSERISGEEAFNRYAAVSMPALQQAGGSFLMMGSMDGGFLGEDEDWDVVAIGQYPNKEAFLKLYGNPEYQKAFPHRSAACKDQKVYICTGQ